MDRTPAVYIVASQRNGTIYTGVTSDLPGRVHQHRHKTFKGFSAKHGCDRLVWFEVHEEMASAIVCEKRIKKWERPWKLELIEKDNPTWRDLAEDWGFEPLDNPTRHPRESGDPEPGSASNSYPWSPLSRG